MKRRCPESRRAALSGEGLPTESHARTCPACASDRAAIASMIQLARELPWTPPRGDRLEAMRARLLSAERPGERIARGPSRRRGSIALGVAAALLAVVASLRSTLEPATTARAEVELGAGAQVVHAAGGPDRPETVRLSHGAITVALAALREGERFVLSTHDAELEAREAIFAVGADRGQLAWVDVSAGTVTVQTNGAAPVVLRLGESWRPTRTAVPEPKAAGPAAAGAPTQPSVSPAPVRSLRKRASQVAPNERAFRDAWAAFARGDMSEAAALFSQAEQAAPGASLAEDACYGRAVALDRAGLHAEATAEMERFLERYPDAVRAEEVSVALGWLLLASGALDEAERRLDRGRQSAIAEVRTSAERGLEDLARRRRAALVFEGALGEHPRSRRSP
ncbi:MAG: hypothetical protein IT384_33045 [Deltaproteobacteria bacterium]|nr:hypothetical protein [Deltaproteobacteria bacterium]